MICILSRRHFCQTTVFDIILGKGGRSGWQNILVYIVLPLVFKSNDCHYVGVGIFWQYPEGLRHTENIKQWLPQMLHATSLWHWSPCSWLCWYSASQERKELVYCVLYECWKAPPVGAECLHLSAVRFPQKHSVVQEIGAWLRAVIQCYGVMSAQQ